MFPSSLYVGSTKSSYLLLLQANVAFRVILVNVMGIFTTVVDIVTRSTSLRMVVRTHS